MIVAGLRPKSFSLGHDLSTAEGLAAGFAEAGYSWAELSRRSAIPPSTLKSRAKRLGVSVGVALAPSSAPRVAVPGAQTALDLGQVGHRRETGELMADLADRRREQLAAILRGEADEIGEDDLQLLVELDSPLMRADHLRLLSAASLALQYWPSSYEHNQRKYIEKFAATCQVDPKDLDAYVLVLRNEIAYRTRTGLSPLDSLPEVVAGSIHLI